MMIRKQHSFKKTPAAEKYSIKNKVQETKE